MNVKAFIVKHIASDAEKFFGASNNAFIEKVADDWLDTTGSSGSLYRIDKIRSLIPDVRRILDLGAGCGTFVFFALRHGYDAFGIEPEKWKLEAVRLQVRELLYDPDWMQRIFPAYGENLPFADSTFDCVTTFQTIEHVQDVAVCCKEMVRVVRSGGCIYLRCPDFARSTFEGHYGLAWLPGLWGKGAETYLKLRGKPLAGLRSLTPVSWGTLAESFHKAAGDIGARVRIVNIDYLSALRRIHLRDGLFGKVATAPLFLAHYIRLLFRAEYAVHMAVFVEKK